MGAKKEQGIGPRVVVSVVSAEGRRAWKTSRITTLPREWHSARKKGIDPPVVVSVVSAEGPSCLENVASHDVAARVAQRPQEEGNRSARRRE